MHLVVVGGSDAGISVGLRVREIDPTVDVTLVVADAYPNSTICGIPHYISGDVLDWRDLAHRTRADLEDAGLTLRTDTRAVSIAARGVAAGDCVVTQHRQLGPTYLPLGTTAHKQGRVAGANAVGGAARFRGSLGTQVVKIFDLVVARTGLRDHEATSIGLDPVTVHSSPYDHKAYYPPGRPTSAPNGPSRHPRSLTGVRAPPPNRRSTS